MTRTGPFARLGLIALVLTTPPGCAPATSTVTGTVTLDGTPVAEGTISFLMEDGTVHTAFITAGSYQVDTVPVGRAKVTVLTKQVGAEANGDDLKNQGATGAAPKAEGPKVIIPAKYASPDTSGLACEVRGSATKYDVPLTK